MAVVQATLTALDLKRVIDTWAAAGGPTDEEKIEFAEGALHELRNDPDQHFQENVKLVGFWANRVDASINTVTRRFEALAVQFAIQFPQLALYLQEWRNFKLRWESYVRDSGKVASQHVEILRRFDNVFLAMVEQIQTDQDRLDVIAELQQFIDEDHSDSIRMSENFHNLKRDIDHFVQRFDQWIIDQGVALDNQARVLQGQIAEIQRQIEGLDKQINDATIALAVSGGLLNIIGMIVAGSLLSQYQAQRSERERELRRTQLELEEVNQKQAAVAHLRTQIDILRPEFALNCDKLILFAEIWSSVRSQSVQLQAHLKGGTGAETNMRFKMEVRLAREVCLPLMEGLQEYAIEFENWPLIPLK